MFQWSLCCDYFSRFWTVSFDVSMLTTIVTSNNTYFFLLSEFAGFFSNRAFLTRHSTVLCVFVLHSAIFISSITNLVEFYLMILVIIFSIFENTIIVNSSYPHSVFQRFFDGHYRIVKFSFNVTAMLVRQFSSIKPNYFRFRRLSKLV